MHPFYGEIGTEVTAEHVGRLELDEAGFRSAVGEDVEHELGFDPSFGTEDYAFVEGLQDV